MNANAPAPDPEADLADPTDCELGSWPYYARACVRDETPNAGRAIPVRLVAPDRISVSEQKAASGPAPIRLSRAALIAAASFRPKPAPVVPPAGWLMSTHDIVLYMAADDFVRRTVR